ncbi:MAG: zinc ribbon domain-containing protein [Desulfosudaceae bacterium]
MPIYEFKCDKCGREFEELVMVSSRDKTRCPDCGHTKVKKLISRTSGNAVSSKSSGACAPSPSTGFS